MIDDRAMKDLHRRTLGVNTTTDVLTFDMREHPRKLKSQTSIRRGNHREGIDIDLETMICVDEARRRARDMGHSLRAELLLYCVHSLLHVQGYDDRTTAGARRMHRREDELLQAIGVGAVYEGMRPAPARGKRAAA